MRLRATRWIRQNAVALLALFVALGGTGYAAATIDGSQIKNRTISGKKLKTGTLGGRQVKERALGKVRRATRADSAASADRADAAALAARALDADRAATAADAGTLDGIDSGAFTRRDCSSSTGAIKGYAVVAADGAFSSTFTTTGVTDSYNCSGGVVEARRTAVGHYEVRFTGAGDRPAVGSAWVTGLGPVTWPGDLNVAIGPAPSGGVLRVAVYYAGSAIDFPFAIALL